MSDAQPRDLWLDGVEKELAFWRSYFAGAGLDWPHEYQARLDPDQPVQPLIARHLPSDRTPRVLDCAAGPASTVGKTFNGKPIELVAIDALADRYAAMLHELGINPPEPTLQGEVELLNELDLGERFDVVYMRFALDHCHDPVSALTQMCQAARPEGVVIIEHYRDAEQHETFVGLRQWALDPVEGDLIIRNRNAQHSLHTVVKPLAADIQADDDWLTVTISSAT